MVRRSEVGPPPSPVGPERLEALARRAMEQMDPRDYVGIIFDGEPVSARFVCLACDELLPPPSRGERRCGGCGYVLTHEGAELVVDHRRALLNALCPSSGLAVAPRRFWWRILSGLFGRG